VSILIKAVRFVVGDKAVLAGRRDHPILLSVWGELDALHLRWVELLITWTVQAAECIRFSVVEATDIERLRLEDLIHVAAIT